MSGATARGTIEIVYEMEEDAQVLSPVLWALLDRGANVSEYSIAVGEDELRARLVTDDPAEVERLLGEIGLGARKRQGVEASGSDGLLDRLTRRFTEGAERLELRAAKDGGSGASPREDGEGDRGED